MYMCIQCIFIFVLPIYRLTITLAVCLEFSDVFLKKLIGPIR